MKIINKQKELLLLLHSKFFSNQLVEVNNTQAENWYTQKEQMKDACRNGLPLEILPECFDKAGYKSESIWEINDTNSFIDLVFCKYTQTKEKQFSLNPYIFMQVQGFN